jgi:hypothetical protein
MYFSPYSRCFLCHPRYSSLVWRSPLRTHRNPEPDGPSAKASHVLWPSDIAYLHVSLVSQCHFMLSSPLSSISICCLSPPCVQADASPPVRYPDLQCIVSCERGKGRKLRGKPIANNNTSAVCCISARKRHECKKNPYKSPSVHSAGFGVWSRDRLNAIWRGITHWTMRGQGRNAMWCRYAAVINTWTGKGSLICPLSKL